MGKLKRRITDKLTNLKENFHSTLDELRTVVNDEETVRLDRMKKLSEKLNDLSTRMNTLEEFSDTGL
ncbi:MAG: hypothetical protein ACP5D9_03980 [Mariniphaga sp.]